MAYQEGAQCINAILPKEILVQIASLLDEEAFDKRSLKSFSQVCKQWRLIGREGVRSLPILCPNLGENPIEEVARRLEIFSCLDSLHLVLADDSKQALELHERVLDFVHRSSVHIKHLEFSFLHGKDCHWPEARHLRLPTSVFGWERLESLALHDDLVLGELPETEAAKWTCLKKLKLSRCNDLHTASNQWTSLQNLHIENLELEGLPVEIGNWKELKVLVVGSPSSFRDVCSQFQQFPPSVSSWSKLEVLRLHAASSLQSLPPGASAWSELCELSLSHCSNLTELPSQAAAWRNLRKLELKSCFLLHSLPVEVNCWKRLRMLTIEYCTTFQDLSEGVRGWTDLQELTLERCDALETLPVGVNCWRNLKSMSIHVCDALKGVPNKGRHWFALESLFLSRSRGIKTLLPVEESAERSKDVVSSTASGSLQETLRGHFWGALVDISLCDLDIEFLPECVDQWVLLQKLTLYQCNKLRALPSGVRGWKQLQRLSIQFCERLEMFPREVCEWKQLRRVHLTPETFESGRVDLPQEVGAWEDVEDVHFDRLVEVPESAQRWSKLTRLCMRNLLAHKLPETVVAAWKDLRSVIIHGPELLALPVAIGAWEQLEQVQLLCPKLERLPDTVGNWTSAKLIAFGPCVSGAIPAGVFPRTNHSLDFLFSLGHDAQACRSLDTLPETVSRWSEVLAIVLRSCSNLHQLPGRVGKWPKLQALDLTGCSANLVDVPEIMRNKCLKKADL